MNSFYYNLCFFLILYLVIFVFCYFIAPHLNRKEKKKEKKKKKTYQLMNEGKYLILRYHLDEKKVDYKVLNLITCNLNAFIISFTSTVIGCLNFNMGIKLAISFVLLFLLIYALFEIVGRILNKKWGIKDAIYHK